VEYLTRHTIVLAEEKSTIQRLVKKAVETKPMGQEKIANILTVSDDTSLVETLSNPNLPVSILLLSTTFSTRSHQSLIKDIAERQPGIKVISLTHKYGDRSSMDYGAFESVDKPIRNPVLWERIDRAIEMIEEMENKPEGQVVVEVERIKEVLLPTPSPLLIEPELQVPVAIPEVEFSLEEPEIEMEDEFVPEPTTIKQPVAIHPPSSTSLLVISDDDDDDDDDELFGTPDSSYKKKAFPVVSHNPVVVEEKPVAPPIEDPTQPLVELETEFDVEPEEEFTFSFDETELPVQEEFDEEIETHAELGHDQVIFDDGEDVEFKIPETVRESETPFADNELDSSDNKSEDEFLFDFTESDESDEVIEPEEMPEESFIFEITEDEPEEAEDEPNVFDLMKVKVDAVDNTTSLEVTEAVEPIGETPIEQTPERVLVNHPPNIKPPSDTLEPIREINTESPSYNELSEWTLANEGFRTKNGDFVSLAPPRELMNKHLSSNGRVQKTTTQAGKTVATDGDKLFGSVRNIFKKK
jgi:hypothetical protein